VVPSVPLKSISSVFGLLEERMKWLQQKSNSIGNKTMVTLPKPKESLERPED